MKDIKTSLLLPEDIWKDAKVKAAQEGISFGELIRKAIREYLGKETPKRKEGRK